MCNCDLRRVTVSDVSTRREERNARSLAAPKAAAFTVRTFGILLLAAASSRGWRLLFEPTPGDNDWAWHPLLILELTIALAVGVWLISGLRCRWACAAGVPLVLALLLADAFAMLVGRLGDYLDFWPCRPSIALFCIELPFLSALLLSRRCLVNLPPNASPRKDILLASALIVLVSGGFGLACASYIRTRNVRPPSGLVAVVNEVDLGAMAPSSTEEAVFQLRNPGATPVRIERVVSSCGCTSTVLGKTLLEAGEGTEILARFTGKTQLGRFTVVLNVVTDLPDAPLVSLRIRGEVVPPEVVLEPATVNLGVIRPGSHHTVRLTLKNRSKHAIDVVFESAENVVLKPWVDRTLLPGQTCVLAAQVAAPQVPGPLKPAIVRFSFNGLLAQEAEATITGFVRPAYRAIPPTLMARLTPGMDRAWCQPIRIVSDEGRPVDVETVRCDDRRVNCQAQEGGRIMVEVAPAAPTDSTETEMPEPTVVLAVVGESDGTVVVPLEIRTD